jgi:hypothetical protein
MITHNLCQRWPSLLRISDYAIAVFSVAVAIIAAELITRSLDIEPIASLMMLAVILSAWLGGSGPALLAITVGLLAFHYYLTPSIDTFPWKQNLFSVGIEEVPRLVLFAITSLLVVSVISAQRKATEALRRSGNDLQAAVEAQKRIEAALVQSEDRLQLVIDTIPTLVWRAGPEGNPDLLNQPALDYTGLTLDQAEKGWPCAFHPDDKAGMLEKWGAIRESGMRGELEARLRRFDGEYRWFLFRAEPLRDALGNIVKWYGSSTDIEDRKRTEEILRRSEAYLSEAQRLSHTGSWAFIPATGKHTYWSEEIFRITGFDPARGPPRFEEFERRVHPDDRARTKEHFRTAIREKADFDHGYRMVHPGGEIRDIHVIGHPVLRPSGDLVEFVGTLMDVTERRRAEEERQALAHANRIATMGQLTASIAHEVNQPITTARNNAASALRFLSRIPPDLEEVREALGCVLNDVDRAGDVIAGIRKLIQKAPAPRGDRLDINEAIREVIVLTRGEALKNGVSVRMQLAEGLPIIQGDRVQLQQIVLNLILNAVEAMNSVDDGRRELSISTERRRADEVLVAVRDSGPGIDPEQLERVFDSFYTSKPSGMGLGLAICRSIVDAHEGRLWADANEPRGAVFQFTLPAGNTFMNALPAPCRPRQPSGRNPRDHCRQTA